LVREPVLLAGLPVLGYACAVAFADTRARVLGIPLDFVSVGPDDVFRAALAVLAVVGVVYVAVQQLLQLLTRRATATFFRRAEVLAVIGAALFLYAARAGWKTWLGVVGFVLGYGLIFNGIPWVVTRLLARYGKGEQKPTVVSETGMHALFDRLPFADFIVLVLFGIIVALAAVAGSSSATHQRVFMKVEGTEDVLVGVYGNTLVMETYSHDRLSGRIVIVDKSQRELRLVPVSVGPLKSPKTFGD